MRGCDDGYDDDDDDGDDDDGDGDGDCNLWMIGEINGWWMDG